MKRKPLKIISIIICSLLGLLFLFDFGWLGITLFKIISDQGGIGEAFSLVFIILGLAVSFGLGIINLIINLIDYKISKNEGLNPKFNKVMLILTGSILIFIIGIFIFMVTAEL